MPEDQDVEVPCFTCKKSFNNKSDLLINCEYCESWFCISCLGMKNTEYNHHTKSSGMWFCAPCKVKVVKNICETKTIEEKCKEYFERFETKLKLMEDKLETKCSEEIVRKIIEEKIKDNAKTLNQSMNDKVIIMDEKMKENNLSWNKCLIDKVESVNETVRKSADEVKTSVQKEKDEIVEETMHKLNEQQDRANNILIFNMEESKEIIREKVAKHDQDCLDEIIKVVLPTTSWDEIFSEAPSRLGSKRVGKVRPVLIKFKHIDYKKAFFANVKNLEAYNTELFKKTFFVHDLSEKEREKERELVVEMKDKNKDAQDFVYRIRGPPHNRALVRQQKKI